MSKAKTSPIRKLSEERPTDAHSIVKLLLADHKLLRTLMKKVKSQKATPAQARKAYAELKDEVYSHVEAEERTFLKLIMDHPKFEDHAFESYEEHRVHDMIFAGIAKTKNLKSQTEQMKIYCEMLEHHLDEEEEDLFPRFKKIFAKQTVKKAGKKFLKVRKITDKTGSAKGAKRFAN